MRGHEPGGPYFDDLEVGQVFDWAPSMTLTAGAAAVHQSIIGDRLRLRSTPTSRSRSPGRRRALAHPQLVCDVAIGQTTLATQRVKANLFYRGLSFHRFPVIGDTLFTRTEVVGLKQNSAKPGRAADRPCGAADDDDRPDRPAGARLPPLRDAAAARRRRRHRPRRRHVGDRRGPGPGARPDRRAGTPTHSAPGCRAPTSTPVSQARCCTAPPMSSAAPPSWPG